MQHFSGIVTQGRLFELQHMIFGFIAAPAHFYSIMQNTLDAESGRLDHSTYLDDIMLGADDGMLLWEAT